MFEEYINRENIILEVLQEFAGSELDFIVIGGYAISAFKHRFSVDVDVVIKSLDKEKFESILLKKEFKKTVIKKLDHVYASEFIRYEKKEELPVSVDLLIGGIGSRTTNASFSFEQLKENSELRKILGTEKEVTVRVPKKEILVILKIHSGRLTDFRDIVAISKSLDFELIKRFIWRGEKILVKENIKKLLSLLGDKGFIDSFKGVFIEKKYDVDLEEVNKFKELLK